VRHNINHTILHSYHTLAMLNCWPCVWQWGRWCVCVTVWAVVDRVMWLTVIAGRWTAAQRLKEKHTAAMIASVWPSVLRRPRVHRAGRVSHNTRCFLSREDSASDAHGWCALGWQIRGDWNTAREWYKWLCIALYECFTYRKFIKK